MTAEDATTDLEAELLADSAPRKRACPVCLWLADRDDAADWDRAFLNPNIKGRAIWRKMASLGFTFTKDPVLTHRNGQHRV